VLAARARADFGRLDQVLVDEAARIHTLRPPQVHGDLGAFEVEAESHLAQAAALHRLDEPTFAVRTIEHEKAAAARAHHLAADGAGLARGLVVLVDRAARDARRELALLAPVDVQKLAEAVDLAALEQSFHLVAELLDFVHRLDGRRLAGEVPGLL